MLSVEEASQRILATVPEPFTETLPLAECLGRFVTAPCVSDVNLPGFDNSAMDGYAVRAIDLEGAGPETPVSLRRIGQVAAGEADGPVVEPGTCVRIFTGSRLPVGCDAVVMQEDTREEGGEVVVLDRVTAWENVRFKGEDLKAGTRVVEAGARVGPGLLAVLAGVGCGSLSVAKPPRVALLATGSELREGGTPLGPAQLYESNRRPLEALARQAGAQVTVLPLEPDDPVRIQRSLSGAFENHDIVVTSGGASVGSLDFLKSSFAAIGGDLDFWKVAVKPGKPFLFGRLGAGRLFGLPGNPVSAFVTFLLFVRPALLRWQGAGDCGLPVVAGRLREGLSNPGDRVHYLRVRQEADGGILPVGLQASHGLRGLGLSNGLVALAPGGEQPEGSEVVVLRWEL